MTPDQEHDPPDAVAELKVPPADIQAVDAADGLLTRHAEYPIHRPKEELDEFMLEVRASRVTRVRDLLTGLKSRPSDPADWLLGVWPLAFGAFLGSLPADLAGALAVVLWGICPLVGVAALVAYFYSRQLSSINLDAVVNRALEELPDPQASEQLKDDQ